MGGSQGKRARERQRGERKRELQIEKNYDKKGRQTDTKTRKGINPDGQKDIYGYRMGRKRRYIRNKSKKGRR